MYRVPLVDETKDGSDLLVDRAIFTSLWVLVVSRVPDHQEGLAV